MFNFQAEFGIQIQVKPLNMIQL